MFGKEWMELPKKERSDYPMKTKKALSVFICVALVLSCFPLQAALAEAGGEVDFIADDAGSAYVQRSSGDTVMKTSSSTDNNIRFKIMVGNNGNRHGYLRFDLTGLDTVGYDIDDMEFNLWYRKSHDPMTLTFTECENMLSSDGSVKWTSDNITYNSRPDDIADSPTASLTITGSGEGTVNGNFHGSVDLSAIFKNALKAGRKEVCLHVSGDGSGTLQFYTIRTHPSNPAAPPPTMRVTLGEPVEPPPPERFTTRVQAEAFYKSAGNIYIRNDGDVVPCGTNRTATTADDADIVLTGADGGKYVDFSDSVASFTAAVGGAANTIPSGQDRASWRVTVPEAGVYQLHFVYNNPGVKTGGYRNDRDERNCRVIINDDAADFTNDMDPHWAGWMIFNVSGFNDSYDPEANTAWDPTTANSWANVRGNTRWNNNYMTVWLDKGENTVTLGIEAPPGQGVYDGPNLDYFDVTYVGDTWATDDEIPYLNDDFVFEHPGINFTLEDLDNIKANKSTADSVYAKGYSELQSAINWFNSNPSQGNAVATLNVGPYNNPNIGGTEITRGASKAYYYALMYYLDGNPAYAKTAISVLNNWASTLTTIVKSNDIKLRLVIVGPDFLNAAEILKYIYNNDPSIPEEDKWSDADMAAFEAFIREMILAQVYDYYPQANGNWDSLIAYFNMALAVYLEDTALFNDALKQRYTGMWREDYCVSMGCLPGYIYPWGENQESSRDQNHARMGITGQALQADLAWNQGLDIYGAYDERVLTGGLYTAAYGSIRDWDGRSDTFISDKTRTQNTSIWPFGFEALANHYQNQVPGAAEQEEIDLLNEFVALRLRSGGTVNNEAGRRANWYAAMVYTDKPYDVSISLSADKNVLSRIGDSITVTADVRTESSLKRVNWDIPAELKSCVAYELIGDTELKLTLTSMPEDELAADIKATSVKKATVTDTITILIAEGGVDKTALDALIAEARALRQEYYTAQSWAALAAAVTAAAQVSADAAATQDEVDLALENLQKAIDGLVEGAVAYQPERADMGNYSNNSRTAAKIFRMKNTSGQYVKVDPATESLGLTDNVSEASTFAMYVLDYYTNLDWPESKAKEAYGAGVSWYSVKCLETGKYLSIQNYFTAEEFLANTHQYYNFIGGSGNPSTNRVYEVKATAPYPSYNGRFQIDYYGISDYFRIFSHLNTYRDDGVHKYNIKMTDSTMQGTGSAAQNTEYRFLFEDVAGSDLLEVSHSVSGSNAELFWKPVNGDVNPANYSVEGTEAVVVCSGGLMRATVSGLSAGAHKFAVKYSGSGYQASADAGVRIFNHPGVLQSTDNLERMRYGVQNKLEPWYSDYQRLLSSVPYDMASFNYTPKPLVGVGRGGGESAGIGDFEKGGNAAYFNALLWVCTGDGRYADKALEILNAWADTLKIIDGRDRILGAGLNGYKYACAAEILRYFEGGYEGYGDNDFKAMQNFMLNVVYPAIIDAGEPLIANGNWDAGAFVTMISIGVLCDNNDIFVRATTMYQDIHINGSIFAYVNENGQTMETGRDQAHAMLAIGCLAETCMIAKNQGVDLYSLYDNRLAKAFEYCAKYNLYAAEMYPGETQVPFGIIPNVQHDTSRNYYPVRFDNDSNGLNRGEFRPCFEQGLALYTGVEGVDLIWTKRAAEATRPQGLVHLDNLNFATLTNYNGQPLDAPCEPYFQLRTRLEPLYVRSYSTASSYEPSISYYDVGESGEVATLVKKTDAPFFRLVNNDDGTYSILLLKTNTYLSVTNETSGGGNVIKADAPAIGENEKFLVISNCVGNMLLASPKYDNRLVTQVNIGGTTWRTAQYVLRLSGDRDLQDVYSKVDNGIQAERLFFMYNTEEIAMTGIAQPLEVSVSTPTIVASLAAYLDITAADAPEGVALRAYLKVGDELLYETAVANGAGRMYIPAAPGAGTYELVVTCDGYEGSCEIKVVPYNTNIWEANAQILEGRLLMQFNDNVALKSGSGCVSIGGVGYNAKVLDDRRTIEVLGLDASPLESGTKITVKGVKYPVLFPSYSFMFTVTVP